MSSEDGNYNVNHVEAWLASDGDLHLGAGFINKTEQIPLGVYLSVSDILIKSVDHINTNHPEKVSLEIMEGVKRIVRNHINLSASVDGKRSKQLTKVGSSNRFVPLEETKEGRLQRLKNKFRKKEDLASEG